MIDLPLGKGEGHEAEGKRELPNFPLTRLKQERKVTTFREDPTLSSGEASNENLNPPENGAKHRKSTDSFMKGRTLQRPKTQSQLKNVSQNESGSIEQKSRNLGRLFNTEESTERSELDTATDRFNTLDKV